MKKILTIVALVTLATVFASADTIDLTFAGANNGAGSLAAVGGTFLVQQINPQSTGTGVIDSFLRVQASTTEQGYNTSNGTPYDDKAGNFTRALGLTEIPIVTINGVAYRQFLLDINQTSSNSLLSLNQIQIFQVNGDPNCPGNPNQNCQTTVSNTTYPVLSGIAGATQVFQMSGGSAAPQHTIAMDYNLNPGSGAGDMFLYVPDADFNSSLSNVILYSQFGNPPGSDPTNDGFEEWAVLKPAGTPCIGCTVPEPESWSMFGAGLLGLATLIRRKLMA